MAADSTLPRVSDVLRNDTHRLIPWRYSGPKESGYDEGGHDESVLTRLTDNVADLNALFELEGATNDRLLGEAGLLPGITLRELVFGLSYSHIVNAAFTHPNPAGSRFNGPERGAWYAAFARSTSELEVAYHRSKELQEINWQESETFTYVDFLADFRGQFHDIRNDARFRNCLDPNSYITSQQLATRLLEQGVRRDRLSQRAAQVRHMHRLFQAGAGEQCPQGRHNLHPIRERLCKTRNSRHQIVHRARRWCLQEVSD